MSPPLGFFLSESVRRRREGSRGPAVAALVLLTAILAGQPAVDESLLLPDLDGELPDIVPELDLPFLAVPFELAVQSPVVSGEMTSELPAVDRFLTARAIPVPVMRCRGFEFEGNTIFTDDELTTVIHGFLDRELLQEDLDQLRFEITRHHVSNGYLNSGATLPDQGFRDGILKIKITEGRLTEVISVGNTGLSEHYLSSRILGRNDSPLHFPTLQRRMQVLQQNDNIIRLNAELKPGLVPGEALMVMEVAESPAWSCGMDFYNQVSPSVGGEQADIWYENRNLTGWSDVLRARFGLFSGDPEDLDFAGFDNLSIQYQRPVLPDDTTFLAGFGTEAYSILEEPFRSLAIDGESYSVYSGFRRPFHRTLQDEVWLSLLLEKSHDETTVLGRPFSISPGSVNGELDLTMVRLGMDWTRRTSESVLSLRSVLTVGLNALDATEQVVEPDGGFLTWLLESQFSRRVDDRGDLLVLHGSVGLSNDPLPPPAQFRLGGRYTVRGYRENFLVRDNGVGGGVEFHAPVFQSEETDAWSFWLVPFLDGGVAWNDGVEAEAALLATGLGLRANYSDWFSSELFWGIPLLNRDNDSGDLQDQGIHFRINLFYF